MYVRQALYQGSYVLSPQSVYVCVCILYIVHHICVCGGGHLSHPVSHQTASVL